LQCVNGHQSTSFLHLSIQRFDLKTRSFINEFRMERLALGELFAEEITSILTALVGVPRTLTPVQDRVSKKMPD
jgi:hypothetical protein